MRVAGILLAVLGVFVLLGGAAMDTTETRQSCVEYESTWGDGYSCAEYEYSNPFPSIATMTLGGAMILGGIFLGKEETPRDFEPTIDRSRLGGDGRSQDGDRRSDQRDGSSRSTEEQSFAARLQEHEENRE